MARQHIFEYAVIYHPRTSKKDEEGAVTKKSEIIQDVKRVLASDVKEVGILAARDIPEKYLDKLDTVEIAIRPF